MSKAVPKRGAPASKASTIKRSITIEASVDERAHELVGERGFSALVNQALANEVQRRRTQELLRELDSEYGPLTEEDLREGRLAWQRLSE